MANVEDQIRHATEGQIHVHIVPGTEVMVDVEGVHLLHARNQSNDTVLVPQPSSNPSDPLNWTSTWKLLVLLAQGLYVFFNVMPTFAIAPLYPILMEEWHRGFKAISVLTGINAATYGTANFIIVPCADIFGRRLVLLTSGILVLCANIWAALATSYKSFLGSRVLGGLGAAANESIMVIVVADMFFLHNRGKWISVYFYCYLSGVLAGPIISGTLAEHASWRWFFWFCTITEGFVVFLTLLLIPETRRAEIDFPHRMDVTVDLSMSTRDEQDKPTTSHGTITAHDENLGRGHPLWGQFALFQKINASAVKELFWHFVTPFQLFFLPITFWATVTAMFGANNSLALSMNVGFSNFALLAGVIPGLLCGGPFLDWVAMRATKRNNGIREPEMRLPTIFPFLATLFIGVTIIGAGFEHGWPWEAPVLVGFTLVGLSITVIQSITSTYAIDCYKPVTGGIMNLMTVLKNMFGLGMSYYFNDWIESAGFMTPLCVIMALTVGFGFFGVLILMRWGKEMRKWTRNSKLHSL